jgi:hypothetical protein
MVPVDDGIVAQATPPIAANSAAIATATAGDGTRYRLSLLLVPFIACLLT